MGEKFQIESSKLLAVEGEDEKNFFMALLKHLGIDQVQIVDIGGKDKFSAAFQTLYNYGWIQEDQPLRICARC